MGRCVWIESHDSQEILGVLIFGMIPGLKGLHPDAKAIFRTLDQPALDPFASQLVGVLREFWRLRSEFKKLVYYLEILQGGPSGW